MKKPTILLMTTWYPSKDDPYRGGFFKEQAIATADYYNYIVLHCYEMSKTPAIKILFQKIRGKEYSFGLINEEENTIEYDLKLFIPAYVWILDIIVDLFKRYIKKVRVDGVGMYRSRSYYKWRKRIIEIFLKDGRIGDFDYVYCINAQKESLNAYLISDYSNKPLIVSEHAPFPRPGTVIDNYQKECIEKADLVLAISYDKIRQIMLQNVHPKKIAYIGNMVNEEYFVQNEKKSEETPTFIIVAAYSFYKNYQMFINVMDKLNSIAVKDFKILVVGYGVTKGYSKNVEELEKMIACSSFSDKTELIRLASRKEMNDLYNRSNAFVMTSIQEGMPVSALEAACCGLPIFSTICGGVEDYVTDEIGRLFKMYDSDSMARSLNEYLNGEIIFSKEKIREYIISIFGKKAFSDRFKRCFEEVYNNDKC